MVGILFESNEWSDHKLAAEVRNLGIATRLIDVEDPASEKEILPCDLLVSRIFASAQFRGHSAALKRMPLIMAAARRHDIPLVNPMRAHFFEIDKRFATHTLASAGFATPVIHACGKPEALDCALFAYPCVIKPNCGGRTTYTAILRCAQDARAFLEGAPDIEFIVQEYLNPVRGFLTRIEIVGGACALTMKRSIAENGLSAYRLGSRYQRYDTCASEIKRTAEQAARMLAIELGSFDIVEGDSGFYFIDANSVSNVSEDCTDTFGLDLMKAHAAFIAQRYGALRSHSATARKPGRGADI